MAMDVSETFLHDAKDGSLGFRREPPQVCIQIQIDGDLASFRKSFHVPAHGREESCLVK
jgi:hypothetical protein